MVPFAHDADPPAAPAPLPPTGERPLITSPLPGAPFVQYAQYTPMVGRGDKGDESAAFLTERLIEVGSGACLSIIQAVKRKRRGTKGIASQCVQPVLPTLQLTCHVLRMTGAERTSEKGEGHGGQRRREECSRYGERGEIKSPGKRGS